MAAPLTPTQILILRDLALGGAPISDLAHMLRMSRRGIAKSVQQLHEVRKVHIAWWEGQAPVYGKGNFPDVPRPPAKPHNRNRAAYDKTYEQKHAEKVRAFRAKYRELHREQYREWGRQRKARMKLQRATLKEPRKLPGTEQS